VPYIIGQVTQVTNSVSSPCMAFQVQCVNKPYINTAITYAPPYFWVTVPQDEYVMQVTSSTGGSAQAVAKALTTFGGVRLNIAVA
jgi:hypothetical protein